MKNIYSRMEIAQLQSEIERIKKMADAIIRYASTQGIPVSQVSREQVLCCILLQNTFQYCRIYGNEAMKYSLHILLNSINLYFESIVAIK